MKNPTLAHKSLLLVAGTALAATKLFALTTGNLLLNPGAETGDLSHWTIGGPAVAFVDNGAFNPGIGPHSGSFAFVGGDGNVMHTSGPHGSLSQIIALVGNQGITAGAIDSGSAIANLSFWEQGLNQGPLSDDAYVSLRFLDASLAVLASPYTPEIDSHNLVWQNYATGINILPGTRFIEYSMQFVRHVGNDLDGYVDDNSLTVTTQSIPDGGSTALALGLAVLGLDVLRRSGKRA